MKRTFITSATATAGLLIALLAFKYVTPMLASSETGRFLFNIVAVSRGSNSTLEDWGIIRGQTTGYYEKLLSGTGQPSGARTLTRRILDAWEGRTRQQPPDPYVHGGFLVYAPKANLRWEASIDPKVLYTNSFGLPDQEYAREKPAGTRRVAWLGDSVSRGYGVGAEERFETIIEERLNREARERAGARIEILNFSVDGYRGTQLFDVGMDQASAFQPDVYVMTLSQLTVAPNWGAHLARLVHDGVDLKYDFLREIVKTSGLRPNDDPSVVEAKLTSYRLPALREMLRRLELNAERNGARFMVILLPAVEDAGMIRQRFEGVRELIEGQGVPLVDLLDTFDHATYVESERVEWHDLHPNPSGHQLLADNLYRKLSEQPEAWSAFTGLNGR